MLNEVQVFNLKEIVRVISSDPPCKNGNVRFTTAPLKDLSGQEQVFKDNLIVFKCRLSSKVTRAFYQRKTFRNYQNKALFNLE